MSEDNGILKGLASALAPYMQGGAQYKHDLPANFTLSTNFMHGPTGIFGTPGADPTIFSTRVRPRGLLEILPARNVVDMNPITYYLTGFTAPNGSEPSAPCTECVKAGNIKSCRQGTVFGLICRETDEIDLSAIGQHTNRGEFFDLRLANDPLLQPNAQLFPPSIDPALGNFLNNEVMARWVTLGAAFEQVLSQMVFTGSPLNNVGTGYAEYQGLQTLVNTGHTDVINQTSCPSLDSDIKDFRNSSVENDAAGLFALMTMLYRYVEHNATTMGFNPVQWVWVIKDSLFRKIADYWPCVYASFRCNANANQIANSTDAMEMRRMSDALYNGRYLTIDGKDIPVIVDDSIPYVGSAQGFNLPAGTFSSSIYLLPLTVIGGTQVLFMEYFDYSAPGAAIAGANFGKVGQFFTSDAGKWLWVFNQTRYCINWVAKIQPRLRLLTPHLAGRILNVVWSPLQMFREPFNNQGYFVNGGNYSASNVPYSITR